jgi:hypothetical protein
VSLAPTPLSERDPEFRPDPGGRVVPDVHHEDFVRLIANPFLALFAILAFVLGVRLMLGFRGGSGSVVAETLAGTLALILVMPDLIQVHCLDCGRTSRIRRWRDHLCPAVAIRIRAGRRRRLRGPRPWMQVVLWLYVLLGLAVWLGPRLLRGPILLP